MHSTPLRARKPAKGIEFPEETRLSDLETVSAPESKRLPFQSDGKAAGQQKGLAACPDPARGRGRALPLTSYLG